MSQISVHNESSLATIHSSNTTAVTDAVKHLAAVLRLLHAGDQLKMMVRLESVLPWNDEHIRYLAVVSSHSSQSQSCSGSHSSCQSSPFQVPPKSPEEFCILGIDVPVTAAPSNAPLHPNPAMHLTANNSAPSLPQKAQRSHSSVSPDQHQGIGSRIASRTRKFLTLPKQKNQPKLSQSPTPRLAKRPSVSSSIVMKLDELLGECTEENSSKVHIGLALPIWADSKITLDGDGGFRVENRDRHHSFKPVSVQAMWSVLQTLLKASENARLHHQLSPAAVGHRLINTSVSTHLSTITTTGNESNTRIIESSLITTTTTTTTTTTSCTSAMPNCPEACTMTGSHGWVEFYASNIESKWVKEWHLILDECLSLDEEIGVSSKSRRPLSPHLSRHRQQECTPTELQIRRELREVMMRVDLEQVNSKEIRQRVEENLKLDLSNYKSFIDHEILAILGQMDAASEIFDYLYLGTEWNAGNLDELRQKGITLVLNVTTEINNFFPGTFDYKNIRVNDIEDEDMLQHWDEAFRHINEAKKEGKKVLVHCKMGVSRSASVVIAYAMKANHWNLEDALRFVKERRTCVKPNPGFMRQLEVYEGILDANKYRSSWQSATSGSTLSLCENKSSRYSSSDLDELGTSNLRRAASEYFSSPNLTPSFPSHAEFLKLSSRPATFYLEPDVREKDRSPKAGAKSKKEKRDVKWEAIAEVAAKEEVLDDTFGMFRVVNEKPSTTDTLSKSFSIFHSTETKDYHLREPLGENSSFRQDTNHDFQSRTMPKIKPRQSRNSVPSVFGFTGSSASALSTPVKENKYYGTHGRRPSSMHLPAYSKPKEPVQTLVKYYNELTHNPHTGNPAPQAAQV